jgi:hypothetical protein
MSPSDLGKFDDGSGHTTMMTHPGDKAVLFTKNDDPESFIASARNGKMGTRGQG